jgi:uncharacterized protein YggU (UPF0235/DUF167 family)
MATPLTPVADGVRVAVRLTPRARRNAVQGLAVDAAGGTVLRVAVTAAPEGGRANAALVKLLAKEWRLPKTSIEVAAGATDRRKSLLVRGDAATLALQLGRWLEGIREQG